MAETLEERLRRMEARIAQLDARQAKDEELESIQICTLTHNLQDAHNRLYQVEKWITDNAPRTEMAQRAFLRTHPEVGDDLRSLAKILGTGGDSGTTP